MSKVYSAAEAPQKWSELLDEVSRGEVVTITEGGKPIAEIRQTAEEALPTSLDERIEEMRRRGLISTPGKKGEFKPLAHRPGGLQRFLDERE
jgi:prevent-host-death family protein